MRICPRIGPAGACSLAGDRQHGDPTLKVLMVTNTFVPHVGGVAKSVGSFTSELQRLGHDVLVVAPRFPGASDDRSNLLRVPAIEHFADTGFSLPLPLRGVRDAIDAFGPDVVHSHHPFLLGDTALRIGAERDAPVIFTHHTQYDKYAHYFVGQIEVAAHFIRELAIGYSNLCDAVIAPSQTIADSLKNQGVSVRIEVIPTGIDVDWFGQGERDDARSRLGIPGDAIVIGHVGRLGPEKNLGLLAESVAIYLQRHPNARFVLAGVGPSLTEIQTALAQRGVSGQLVARGILSGEQLRDVYSSMDVFAFTSTSETQGIVLAEAMAAGAPVVAIDAPGVRDIVRNGCNGSALANPTPDQFAAELDRVTSLPDQQRQLQRQAAKATARNYSLSRSTEHLLDLYQWGREKARSDGTYAYGSWQSVVARVERELNIWTNMAHALSDAMVQTVLGSQAAE